jgi:hypothetical protein
MPIRPMILGGPSPVSITAGTPQAVTFPTQNIDASTGFQVGRLGLVATGGNLARAFVNSSGIVLGNDKLTQGWVPAQAFAPDAVGSPRFGGVLAPNIGFSVTVDGDANVEILSYATAADGPTAAELRGDGRSIVMVGQDTAPASLAAGASVDITITPQEPGFIGRFFMSDVGANNEINDLHVIAAYLSGQAVFQGDVPFSSFAYNAVAAPWLNYYIKLGESITLTVKNDDSANAAKPCIAYVVTATS